MAASFSRFLTSTRDLPRAFSFSSWLAALLVVVVVFSGPVLIILQAADAGNLTAEQATSWVWAVTFGSGLLSVIMSLWYRMPVKAAWNTPGAVLLVSSLNLYDYRVAVGAFIIAAAILVVLGVTRLYSRIIGLVPNAVIMGMLAGVLLRFGLGLFAPLADNTVLVAAMILTFFALKRVKFRVPTLGAMAVGLVIAALSGTLNIPPITVGITLPVFTAPAFTLESVLGLSIPLVVMALTTQNAPGVAVLKASGYTLPIDGALIFTGLGSLLLAPFGCHGLNLAAITAAMITNPEAHKDPNKRYTAGVAMGVYYMLIAFFSAAAVAAFTALPPALISSVAGLALLGTIMNGTAVAMEKPETRDAGLVALLCSAANFNLFGIGAAFWALLLGVVVHLLLTWGKRRAG